jgi:hypothetical protein
VRNKHCPQNNYKPHTTRQFFINAHDRHLWLQRIVNGAGYIRREYAAGLNYIDLVIEYGPDNFGFELKTDATYHPTETLEQVAKYAKRMSVDECYIVVFRRKMPDPAKVGERTMVEHDGLKVHLIWM